MVYISVRDRGEWPCAAKGVCVCVGVIVLFNPCVRTFVFDGKCVCSCIRTARGCVCVSSMCSRLTRVHG